jgi:hypothetical protein
MAKHYTCDLCGDEHAGEGFGGDERPLAGYTTLAGTMLYVRIVVSADHSEDLCAKCIRASVRHLVSEGGNDAAQKAALAEINHPKPEEKE